jgi:2-polyprenyl-3-methyl-5-hydroxy-6-metoxy-1,4-benzoquinol methylase
MESSAKDHWEKIYGTKEEADFSWFQPYPKTSIEFINMFNLPKNAKIIDIGGGDSHLVDALLELGYTDIYVLDISAKAIERAKARLGAKAKTVQWIVSDVTEFKPTLEFDFWHDRAAFHFLTSEAQIIRYLAIVSKAIKQKGHLVLGTFSESGPKKCSGLDIKRYTEVSLSTLFEKDFKRIKCVEETHTTPFNTTQNFVFCSFQKLVKAIL